MKLNKVFQRIPNPETWDDNTGQEEWAARMDNLLLSDPREVLAFVSDALIAIAAQAKEEVEDPWAMAISMVERAGNMPERDVVIEIARKRLNQLLALLEEGTDHSTGQIIRAAWKASDRAPWPE